MQNTLRKPALDAILESLLNSKQDNEFKMTREGFKTSNSKAYDPRDLKICKAYHFEGSQGVVDSYTIYLIMSNDGLVGYSLDSANDFQKNEDSLYNWFITKIPVEDIG